MTLQKEYEAEKLVRLIDQLDRKGLIKPCKIDEVTGKPVHVEVNILSKLSEHSFLYDSSLFMQHVLELQKEIPEQQIFDRERET